MGSENRPMMRPSFWYSISAKLAGTFIAIVALVSAFLVVVDLFGLPFSQVEGKIQVRREEAFVALDLLAEITEQQMEDWIAERGSDVNVLATNDLVVDSVNELLTNIEVFIGPDLGSAGCWRLGPVEKNYRELLDLFRTYGVANSGPFRVWLVDSLKERVFLSTDINDLGRDASDLPSFSVLRESSQPYIGESTSALGALRPVLVVGQSIQKDNHLEGNAFLIMFFDVDQVVTPVLSRVKGFGKTGEAFLVNSDSLLLTSLEHPLSDGSVARPMQTRIDSRPSVLAAGGSEGIVDAEDYRGFPVLAAFRHIQINGGTGWGLVVKRDRVEVMAPLRTSIRRSIIAGLISMVVFGLLGVLVARTFVKPVVSLSRTARRIADGDLGARADVKTHDEVGQLAEIFNSMVVGLEEVKEDLESEVWIRTLNLEETKEALESEINERRRTEASLRESEALYRAVSEDSPVMLCRFLPDGEITFANEAYRKYFQRDGANVVGRGIGLLGLEPECDAVHEFVGLITPERPNEDHEYQGPTVGDGIRWIHWSNRGLFDIDGGLLSILSVGLDITERKEIEEKLQDLTLHLEDRIEIRTNELNARVSEVEDLNRAMLNLADDVGGKNEELVDAVRRMGEANRDLESFAYSVSHDLRAPLRHIAGFVEILQESLADKVDETEQRYLNLVDQSAIRMSRLIDDLLTFSRTSTRELQLGDVDLGHLVKLVSAEVADRSDERKITWRIGNLPIVFGDNAMLRQVLVNLLENAVKFTRNREPALIEIGSDRGDDGEQVVWIRDNGVGFDPKYTDKLFGVFQRLHRREDFEGTGIGLANVRRIIVRHGGKVWAEGEVDKGATFFFSLPLGRRMEEG